MTFDQLWLKSGSPKEIEIKELDIQTDKYPHLRKLIFGSADSPSYDGVNFHGIGANRHLTYRVKQAIKTKIEVSGLSLRNTTAVMNKGSRVQSVFGKSYADSAKNRSGNIQYSVPTSNRFSPLN